MSIDQRPDQESIPWQFLVLCAGAFVGLLILGFGTTFRSDEWEFITNRSLADPISLFRPFNGHWLTVPVIIYRVLFQVFELRSYVPYLAVLVLLHVTLAILVYRLLARLTSREFALIGSVIVLVSAYGHENLFWAFQIGMVSATALGIATLIELTGPSPVGWRAALLLTLAIASHAVAFAFLAAAGVFAIASRRWSVVAWTAVPAGILVAWSVTLQLSQLSTQTPIAWPGIPAIVGFIIEGSAASAGAVLGVRPEVGFILLVAGAFALARTGPPTYQPVVAAAAVAIAAEFSMVALVRGFSGPGEAAAPRYLYVSVPLLLVIVAGWIGRRSLPQVSQPRIMFTVAALLVTIAVLGSVRLLILGRVAANTWSDRTRAVSYLADHVSWLPPDSVFQMPPPAQLREIQNEIGRLDRDAMFGVTFGTPPPEAIAWACEQFFPDTDTAQACVVAAGFDTHLARVSGRTPSRALE